MPPSFEACKTVIMYIHMMHWNVREWQLLISTHV
jgi:hypothetical protein